MATNNTKTNVSVGKPNVSGAIYRAPIGTQLPTDATTALNSAFKCLGYVSEDGLKNNNSPGVETVKAWGNETVLTYMSEKEDTFSFTLIEALNLDVLKAVYGSGNVAGALSTGVTITANNEMPENAAFVCELLLNGKAKRIVIPEAAVSEVGEISYTDAEAIGYEITLTAISDEDGVTHYEYIV